MLDTILTGDAWQLAKTLSDQSVQCIVTSPPYFGLRSYLPDGHADKPAEFGCERTPGEYVARLVELFRELRRALRDDGTLWLNLGDSYNNRSVSRPSSHQTGLGFTSEHLRTSWADLTKQGRTRMSITDGGLKEKDLCMIPARVAIALCDDGWYLRSDIIWSKKNCMPESVTDRPTRSHEYVFLLSKRANYYYDAEAIKEPYTESSIERFGYSFDGSVHPEWEGQILGREKDPHCGIRKQHGKDTSAGRNRRSVWTLSSESYSGAHFAVMPTKLVGPCILAGTSAKGACSVCGSPWVRVTERSATLEQGRNVPGLGMTHDRTLRNHIAGGDGTSSTLHHNVTKQTTGWRPTCDHADARPVPCVVLDPFMGSGTVAAVAVSLGRHYIGFELNPAYVELAHARLRGVQTPLFAEAL